MCWKTATVAHGKLELNIRIDNNNTNNKIKHYIVDVHIVLWETWKLIVGFEGAFLSFNLKFKRNGEQVSHANDAKVLKRLHMLIVNSIFLIPQDNKNLFKPK